MLVRIVNWFFFGLCVTVSTLQGENAPVNEMDYWGLRKFSDGQIPFLQNYRNKRDVPVWKFSRFDSLADQDSGVQELSEFFVGNIKCTRFVNFFNSGNTFNFLQIAIIEIFHHQISSN